MLWRQNPKVHHRIHNSPPAFSVLSQVNPLHTLQPISLRSIYIPSLIYALVFQAVFFLRDFPSKACTRFSLLQCVPHALPIHLHPITEYYKPADRIQTLDPSCPKLCRSYIRRTSYFVVFRGVLAHAEYF
jgi:hypothetical protein